MCKVFLTRVILWHKIDESEELDMRYDGSKAVARDEGEVGMTAADILSSLTLTRSVQ